MEKRTPHCKLARIHELVRAGRVRATRSAYEGALELGIRDLSGMCSVVLCLAPGDFHKSMTTYADHRVWQDVYRATVEHGRSVYLKLTVIDDVLIVSFKEW
ncbi:type II toxin-antitoxin system MqsR family toxin [Paraburkholderia sp. Ac-20347]|jgi:motility quorum-sensing regulator / GCU-specific mRNA interferase toxin|uniref:type II toxin-antitoxin system MqsR family toxin n=1 Tax=Paraburkholderia sp. Ac-20347 TaxID=2703892 RepID=UPI001981FE76|nr:type II toxin-antitoxin system MqsR family toxin [Paraburkholderia sp. Ac-20347]MBN3809649.1 type II toxin-antitoxin system MqsR family toxin [Paraburkholderia sp. Ac-20347]